MKHKHEWREHIRDAVAIWQKRDCESVIRIKGTIEQCTCRTVRIVPDHPRLRPVEVIL